MREDGVDLGAEAGVVFGEGEGVVFGGDGGGEDAEGGGVFGDEDLGGLAVDDGGVGLLVADGVDGVDDGFVAFGLADVAGDVEVAGGAALDGDGVAGELLGVADGAVDGDDGDLGGGDVGVGEGDLAAALFGDGDAAGGDVGLADGDGGDEGVEGDVLEVEGADVVFVGREGGLADDAQGLWPGVVAAAEKEEGQEQEAEQSAHGWRCNRGCLAQGPGGVLVKPLRVRGETL